MDSKCVSTGVISAVRTLPLKLCVSVGNQRGHVMYVIQHADIVGVLILA